MQALRNLEHVGPMNVCLYVCMIMQHPFRIIIEETADSDFAIFVIENSKDPVTQPPVQSEPKSLNR